MQYKMSLLVLCIAPKDSVLVNQHFIVEITPTIKEINLEYLSTFGGLQSIEDFKGDIFLRDTLFDVYKFNKDTGFVSTDEYLPHSIFFLHTEQDDDKLHVYKQLAKMKQMITDMKIDSNIHYEVGAIQASIEYLEKYMDGRQC